MSKVSVLVVDDATFIRDLVRKGLRNYFPGVHTDEAVNGRKAQLMLSRESFDLILCDWEMPEMSGLELLTWCRQQENHLKTVPFIMVTSRGDKENVVQAIQAGVSDFMGKPFTNEQLLGKVKKALVKAGKLDAVMSTGPVRASSPLNDSLNALTGGRAEVVRSPAAATAAPSAAPVGSQSLNGRSQAQLRLPSGNQTCIIKSLTLKESQLVIRRSDSLPQILESAVLDLEQGESNEVARLNGYVHAITAHEPKPDSEWLQVTFRFVDQDTQKLDYLSRLIARGTTHKKFIPGA